MVIRYNFLLYALGTSVGQLRVFLCYGRKVNAKNPRFAYYSPAD
ncbi:hypothetical protein [Nitrosomonas marina]|nr:hypothetical protein [Nitrosomonas marina]